MKSTEHIASQAPSQFLEHTTKTPTFRMQVDMPELDFHGWKSALHGFKGDIFNSFKEAQEEIKRQEEKASIAEKRIVDLDPGQAGKTHEKLMGPVVCVDVLEKLFYITMWPLCFFGKCSMVRFAIPLLSPNVLRNRLQCPSARCPSWCIFFGALIPRKHEVSGVPGLQQRVEQLEIQNLELTTNLETSNGWLKFSFSENQQMKAGFLDKTAASPFFS